MTETIIPQLYSLRDQYLQTLMSEVIRPRGESYNIADTGSHSSCAIASAWVELLPGELGHGHVSGQRTGALFGTLTCGYLGEAFSLLQDLRPGDWEFDTEKSITNYEQYQHLEVLDNLAKEHRDFKVSIGSDYLIKSDIIICRFPVDPTSVGMEAGEEEGWLSPLLQGAAYAENKPILHACISCKWTIRSDRAQNVRTEALNLIRNRKGNSPHIMALTAEPLPTRIASLALGTGDIDCVYHAGLHELRRAIQELHNEDQYDMLMTLIEGRRLRDVIDLPFDLAI